ncbi:MAG: hypothetical protein FPoV1_gp4 [Fushun polycipivirus 1]|nr:MAG: hypothetical protein FPoV1_gp4 [Fushun polycipivirus 1]
MSEDNIPKVYDHENEGQGIEMKKEPEVVHFSTSNLINQSKFFGIMSQIYNYQPTGLIVQIDLPVENLHNLPLFVIRISPLFVSFQEMDNWPKTFPRCYVWDQLRPCFSCMSENDLQYDDVYPVPDWFKVIEYDDVPDIALHARHHMFYTGGMKFSLRPITNMTTQGRIAISRINNVQRTRSMFVSTCRVPLKYDFGSQTTRMSNGFDYVNLAAQEDIEIDCPYTSEYPWRSLCVRLNSLCQSMSPATVPKPTSNDYLLRDDYIVVDPIGLLDRSAGSSTFSFAIWVKACDDFQFSGPQPMPAVAAAFKSSHASRRRVPYVFGSAKGSNVYTQSVYDWDEIAKETEV